MREAQKEVPFKDFVKAIEKEIRDYEASSRYEIVHKSTARGKKVLNLYRHSRGSTIMMALFKSVKPVPAYANKYSARM